MSKEELFRVIADESLNMLTEIVGEITKLPVATAAFSASTFLTDDFFILHIWPTSGGDSIDVKIPRRVYEAGKSLKYGERP